MKLSDIIEVVSNRTLFGKRKGYKAQLVGTDMSADGKTAEDATRSLVHDLQMMVRHQYVRHYYFSPSGRTVFSLYWRGGGWSYDITDAKRCAISTQCGSCNLSPDIALDKAKEMVIRHASDYDDAALEPG